MQEVVDELSTVSKSVTLKGVMAVFCAISATSVAFRGHCVEVVEDIPKLSATEM